MQWSGQHKKLFKLSVNQSHLEICALKDELCSYVHMYTFFSEHLH
jgi:hypothetical protein